jgi:hypothetical protein
MRWLILTGRWLTIAAWGVLAPVQAEGTDSARLSEVKAAFVYNFLQFTTWPSAAKADGKTDFTMCVYARGTTADALAALEGKAVDLHPIRVRLWPETPFGCQVLYVAATAEPPRRSLIIYNAQAAGMLTIAEEEQTPPAGVVISLFEDGERLAFAVNLDAARQKGLKLSSKLLRLAKTVHPDIEDRP